VKISGFGNFDILDKKERIGRNPKTGEIAIISARKVVTFRAGKKLRESIQIKDD
jgi:integration host factor subunit alpha